MRAITSVRGQSTAEYAILFAIVIGAAIAMQQYVSSRLRGAVRGYADQYTQAAGTGAPVANLPPADVTPFGGDPGRTTNSGSASDTEMTTATSGTVLQSSGSQTVSQFQGGAGGAAGGAGGAAGGAGGF